MTAILTTTVSARRSALMSRIRSKNTRPELIIRRTLHSMGLRFRIHRSDLPGKPDIVFPRHKLAILVHGCFWHQHPNCRLASKPKTRTDYWNPKLAGNIQRDQVARASLESLGWKVEIVWECDVRNQERLASRIREIAQSIRNRGDSILPESSDGVSPDSEINWAGLEK